MTDRLTPAVFEISFILDYPDMLGNTKSKSVKKRKKKYKQKL